MNKRSKYNFLTEYQYVVMGILSKSEHSGRGLRLKLHSLSIPLQGPTFYQLMNRMEVNGFIRVRTIKTEDAKCIPMPKWSKETYYKPTAKGIKKAKETRAFYLKFRFPTKKKEEV